MAEKVFNGFMRSGKSKVIKEDFIRSLIKVGPNSLAITIPNDVVKRNNLKKGDILLGMIDSVIIVKPAVNTV
jgi:hypothetical protein